MEPVSENRLQEAVALAHQGDTGQAFEMLQQITAQEPENISAWMWLAYVAESYEFKRAALRRVVALRPDDAQLKAALKRLLTPAHIQAAARTGVFIGYTRADELLAVDLHDSLHENGLPAWMDMTEIGLDTTWFGAVQKALHQCGLMLLVVSPDALRSEELRYEMEWFIETGKIVVPVLRHTAPLESLGLLCTPVDFRAGYGDGLHHLLSLLKDSQVAGQSA